jgi:RNA binding exosome subunit
MDVALKRKNGFIYFTANSSEDITRDDALYIQEKYGIKVNDNGFYAFVKKKKNKAYTANWCCRDDDNKLSNIQVSR